MSAAGKISYDEYLRMVRDPKLDESELAPYVTVAPSPGNAFDLRLVANPRAVDMTPAEEEAEDAMSIGNGASRWRRKWRFDRSDKPITLVSEGDSWFQFPILLRDTIDNLTDTYRIRSLGAAGDTARNMIHQHGEYVRVLDDLRASVQGFLLSAAGNDILGEDELGNPVIEKLVRSGVDSDTAADHIDRAAVDETLSRLVDSYEVALGKIRNIPGLDGLPMIIHGYDYAIPGGYDGDPRDPIYASNDKWLGSPLKGLGITEPELQRAIVHDIIELLYDRFGDLDDRVPNVHLVDVRGTLPNDTDWSDEIHPTDEGFARVAKKFDAVVKAALR